MEDNLIMSGKERRRKVVFEQVKAGQVTQIDASVSLGLSYRQTKRSYQRFLKEGDAGLVHGSRGKRGNRAYSEELKSHVLERYEARYSEFGPTLACECLEEEEGIQVHPETLRLWLKEAGLWRRQRKRKGYRRRREARARFGELVQIDGSDHAWFGANRPRSCLLNMVDDATTTSLSGMAKGETTKILLESFKRWVERYGIPLSVYVDLKSVYVSPKRLKACHDDELAEDSWSVFERVCGQLDVEIIKAYSPQAKGRVERNHGVYQDRLVKLMCLKGIHTIEGANQYLTGEFVDQLNKRFAKVPKDPTDAHRDPGPYGDLDQIFCWVFSRQVKNDWTFQFKRQHYQLEIEQPLRVRAKQKIEIRRHLDGKLSAWYKGQALAFHPIEDRPKVAIGAKVGLSAAQRSAIARRNKSKSPWNQYNPGWLKNKPIQREESLGQV